MRTAVLRFRLTGSKCSLLKCGVFFWQRSPQMKPLHGLLLAAFVFTIPGCGKSNSGPAHDLKMVADQPIMVIWANPEQHLKNPAAADLFKAIMKTGPEEDRAAVAAAVPKIDSLKISMSPGKRSYSDREMPIPVVVMHMSDAAAAKSMFEMMTKRHKPRTISEMSMPVYQYQFTPYPGPDGKPEEDKWKLRSGTAQLDPQTLATGETVEKLIAVASAKEPAKPGAWESDFKSLASSQSLMLVDTAKLRGIFDEEFKRHPPRAGGPEALILGLAKPLWEESDYAFLTLDTTDGIKVTGMAKSATPEAAKKFKEALDALVGMGKPFLPLLKPQLAQLKGKSAAEVDKLYKEIETAVNSLSITQDGATTKLALTVKQDSVNQVVSGIFIPLLEEEQKRNEERRARYEKESIKAFEAPAAKESFEKSETKEAIPEK